MRNPTAAVVALSTIAAASFALAMPASAGTGGVSVSSITCGPYGKSAQVTYSNPEATEARLHTSYDEQSPIPAGGSVVYNHSTRMDSAAVQNVGVTFEWADGTSWVTGYIINWGKVTCGGQPNVTTVPVTYPATDEQKACEDSGGTWFSAIGSPAVCGPKQATPPTIPLNAPPVTNPDQEQEPVTIDTSVPALEEVSGDQPVEQAVTVRSGPPRTVAQRLPSTGSSTAPLWLAAALLALGSALILIPRRVSVR